MDCPVCETTNIEESIKICPTCGYDISPYPLVLGEIPVAFIEKEQQRIAWAKKLWHDRPAKVADNTQTQIQDQLNQILSSIQQLSQNQITAAQISDLVKADKADIEAKFSELEKRLGVIIASECDRLAETILDEFKQSLSKDMSSAVSEPEKQPESEPSKPTLDRLQQRLMQSRYQFDRQSQQILEEFKESLSGDMSPGVSEQK